MKEKVKCKRLHFQNFEQVQLSASHYQFRRRYRQWHRHAQNFIFVLDFIFLKEKKICFFLALSYSAVSPPRRPESCRGPGISITLLQILIFVRFPVHPESAIGVLEKRVFEFSEAPIHQCFEKIVPLKTFGNFPVTHPWWSHFLLYLQNFLGIFRKAVQGIYSVEYLRTLSL